MRGWKKSAAAERNAASQRLTAGRTSERAGLERLHVSCGIDTRVEPKITREDHFACG
jgi:hypothetical protein